MRLCFLMRQLIVPHRPDHVLPTRAALLPMMRSAIASQLS